MCEMWHMTCDMVNVTYDTWCMTGGVGSYGLVMKVFWRYFHKGSVTKWMNYKGVCRTTPCYTGSVKYKFLILGHFECPFCKYHLLHYFMKWQQITPAGLALFRSLSWHSYGGEKNYVGQRYVKKKHEDQITFLKGKNIVLHFVRQH